MAEMNREGLFSRRPMFGRNAYILEFDIRYRTVEGEEVTRPAAVVRLGKTRSIFYTDYSRPR
jgi:hypothetical protein